jgi:hypothetical protein
MGFAERLPTVGQASGQIAGKKSRRKERKCPGPPGRPPNSNSFVSEIHPEFPGSNYVHVIRPEFPVLVKKESIVTRTHLLHDVVLLRSLGDHRAAVVLHHPTK